MSRKIKRIVGLSVLLLVAAVLLFSIWLFTTEAGLALVWHTLAGATGNRLQAAQVTGRLAGVVRVRGITLRLENSSYRVGQVTLDWSPLSLLAGRITVQRLTIEEVQAQLHSAPASQESPFSYHLYVPPLPVHIDNANLINLNVTRDSKPLFAINRAHLAGSLDRRGVHFAPFQAAGPWGELDLRGRLGNRADSPVHLQTRWRINLPDLRAPLAGQGTIDGSVAQPTLAQQLTAPVSARITGQLAWLNRPTPTWNLAIRTAGARLDRLLENGRPLQVAGNVTVNGAGHSFDAQAKLALQDPEYGRWNVAGTLKGEPDRYTLERLQLTSPNLPTRVVASGQWQPGGPLQADLDWQALQWPLIGTIPEAVSPSGHLEVTGTLEEYRFQTHTGLVRPGLPPVRLQAHGSGDQDGLTITALNGNVLEGDLNGSGKLTWAPALSWEIAVEAKALNPEPLQPDLKGRIGFHLATTGKTTPQGISAQARLSQLTGNLNGQPLSGSATASLDQGVPAIPELKLRAGSARLDASGQFGPRWQTRWSLHASDLSQLHPRLGGQIDLTGQLTGPPDALAIKADGKARELHTGRLVIGAATLSIDTDLGGTAPGNARLLVSHVTAPGDIRIDRISLTGQGIATNHRLDLDLLAGPRHLALAANGHYRAGSWSATLHDGQLMGAPPATWRQTAPMTVRIGADTVQLQEGCWEAGEASICMAYSSTPTRPPHGDLILHAFPLAAANPLLKSTPLALEGQLEMAAHLGPGTDRLQLSASTANARIRYRTEAEPLFAPIDGFNLTATANSHGFSARLDTHSGTAAQLQARLSSPAWPLAADSPISGTIDGSATQLQWLSLFAPQLLNPSGRLEIAVKTDGTLAAPIVTGSVKLVKGDTQIVSAGIHITELQLQASAIGPRLIGLSGSARSGPGDLKLTGSITGTPFDWSGSINLTGRQFEAANIRKARVFLSPDLKLAMAPYELNLTGKVTVDRAELKLPSFGKEGTVTTSPDVVIVSGPQQPKGRRWAVHTRVTLIMGKEVRLSGYGLDGRLGGQLTITERPNQVATAHGELNVVDGKYQAYGQPLIIEQGRLVYAGTPLTDPALDFRAVRKVDTVTVGIQVSGQLREPVLEIFSDPPMDDSNALSYLILGRPISSGVSKSEGGLLYQAALSLGFKRSNRLAQEIADRFGIENISLQQGSTVQQSAVVLSTHLSPRLYLQYVVGFAQTVNQLRIRYDLGGHWTLEAQSGAQSSTDLLYSIER